MKKALVLFLVLPLVLTPLSSLSEDTTPSDFAKWYVDYGMYGDDRRDWSLILCRLSMGIDRAKPWDIAPEGKHSVFVNMYAGVDFHKDECCATCDLLPDDLVEIIQIDRSDALSRGFFPCPECAK